MNNLWFIILVILMIFFYLNLYRKIGILEKKVSELNDELEEKKTPITPYKDDVPEEISHSHNAAEDHLSQNTVHEKNDLPVIEKDWINPVFDFVKQNILTIIGIFTLVLGIGYFVKYAIDKNWIGESSRTAIGFVSGAALMIAAHFIRKKYPIFASIITGGGIAVLYFTTTIVFREYHLFMQNTAFIITCFITLLSVALSYRYHSETLIIFSLFGGFLAPLMISTGQSNYIFLFTYLTLLNTGMLIMVYLKNWKSVGWIAFFFTAVYLYFWTANQPDFKSIIFYIITYIIFYAFALQNYFRSKKLTVSDIAMLIFINFFSIIGLVYLFNTLHYTPLSIFPFIFAVINFYFAFKEFKNKEPDRNYSIFSGITVSLFTIATALEFKAHIITSVWAVEASLLLFIWRKTDHRIFKLFFYVLFPMVIVSQMITWTKYIDHKNFAVVFNPVFLTSFVVIASCFFNLMMFKNNSQKNHPASLFERFFKILFFAVIYFAILFEIIFHISAQPLTAIYTFGFLYSFVFFTLLLLFRKKLDADTGTEKILIYILLFLYITFAATSQLINSVYKEEIASDFYFIHLLYIVPFAVLLKSIIPKSSFLKHEFSSWFIFLTIVTTISFELCRSYILLNAINFTEISALEKHFGVLYLTIIWGLISCITIYVSLKNEQKEWLKIGFALLGITIIKLYAYDVWQMDHLSRIIAFTILGIILLISSFLFQYFKSLVKTLMDKEKKEEI
ncbi:DUF2339 domain-containing protein [Chryseobacterium taihuense]|uniref:Predicted membrane protein n=1 Tax=Chryseobacterium taihuense TaxID=1141221 RepID=A0ABY0QRD9_9FLAO|nr:DUF2339 domain-containing protein [Chryseobacterium taihuense]SDL60243.1 Predicted membrane protein [Chryseobacterium taihuense]